MTSKKRHLVFRVFEGLILLTLIIIVPMRWNAWFGAHLILQGHDHAYARKLKKEQKRAYVTITTALKTYPVGTPESFDQSEAGKRTYSHLTVTSDTLSYACYAEDHTLLDYFQIVK